MRLIARKNVWIETDPFMNEGFVVLMAGTWEWQPPQPISATAEGSGARREQ